MKIGTEMRKKERKEGRTDGRKKKKCWLEKYHYVFLFIFVFTFQVHSNDVIISNKVSTR